MFGKSNRPVVGLDIGSNTIKMVSLRANGEGYYVAGAAMESIASGNDSGVVSAIRKCLKTGGKNISRGSNFVFGLSGGGVKISSFSFTSLTLEEMSQAVMFEAAQVCPFDIRSSIVDYQLVSVDDKKIADADLKKKKKVVHNSITGVLAVATKDLISRHRRFADEAALKCVLMDSEALALLNCVRENQPDDEDLPIAVVNVGNSVTTVAILGSDGLPFVRDLGHSGKDIIQSLASGKGVSFESMSEEVFGGGCGACSENEVRTACNRLILDVSETFAYYASRHNDGKVNKVYICGGFGLLNDFAKNLADSIANEVCVWNPLNILRIDDGAVDSEIIDSHGPAFAVAAGLAMRQV